MKMDWTKVTKTRWVTMLIPSGEACTPRIESVGSSFYCYRDMMLLGTAKTLEDAKKKCEANDQKTRDLHKRVVQWEKEHPGELPPFIDLSPAQVKAWQRHNPIAKGLFAGVPRPGGSTKVERADVPALPPDSVMSRARDGNPKKEGSSAHKRWSLMFTHCERGSTVSEFLAAGGNAETLRNAVLKGYARLSSK